MAEYIEREALLKEVDDLKKSPWYNDDYGFGTRQARHEGVDCVVDLCIKQAPTADVVEVVHGEWVHIKDCGGGKCSGHCSVCWTPQEAAFPSALKEGFRYCRWCGAKMDGDKK